MALALTNLLEETAVPHSRSVSGRNPQSGARRHRVTRWQLAPWNPNSLPLRLMAEVAVIRNRGSQMLRNVLCLALLGLVAASPTFAQNQKVPEGIWEGYDGEWLHVSQQLIALAETTPADKFSWRPAPGVRSTSEVYMHIVEANFWLLSVTGPKMPADYKEGMDKTVTSKPEVIAWLKRSLDAVKQAHAKLTPADLQRKVHIADRNATLDGMYLRIIVHANEHMGQLVAYARMTGVTPPWSQ